MESGLVRILAREPSGRYQATVDAFLFERPVGDYFTSVASTLWPADCDRFAKAIARYLDVVPPRRLAGTAVMQAFMMRPESLDCLRTVLLRQRRGALWQQVREAVAGTLLPGVDPATSGRSADILRS